MLNEHEQDNVEYLNNVIDAIDRLTGGHQQGAAFRQIVNGAADKRDESPSFKAYHDVALYIKGQSSEFFVLFKDNDMVDGIRMFSDRYAYEMYDFDGSVCRDRDIKASVRRFRKYIETHGDGKSVYSILKAIDWLLDGKAEYTFVNGPVISSALGEDMREIHDRNRDFIRKYMRIFYPKAKEYEALSWKAEK